MEEARRYAFYSEQAAQKFGYCVYRDLNNNPVRVTCVCTDPIEEYLLYKWPDKVFVGEVTKCVRTLSQREGHIFIPIGSKYQNGSSEV